MKIGIIGPIWLNIPPNGYGGTEEVVDNLIKGLCAQGHEVTLFGPGTAKTEAKLVPTIEKPLREMNVGWTNTNYTLYHITEAFDRAEEFDVLHMHLNKSPDYVALPLSLSIKTPVVFTIHFRLPNTQFHAGRHKVLTKYHFLPFTTISNSQREQIRLNYIKTIYNALDISRFPYSNTTEDYFAWLGRINPVKGTHLAIQAAKKAGVRLKIMGKADPGDPAAVEYYLKEVAPLIDGDQIQEIGEVNHEQKTPILAKAKALLNPIQWEEPFGLVMIESQACGTPVISFEKGAASEIIHDGIDGFLVNSVDEMVEKIKKVDTINRLDCRKNVEDHFSAESMAKGYVEAYQDVIRNWDQYKMKKYI
jgi:glycosyltransferase involved in cell wall biosynthesis